MRTFTELQLLGPLAHGKPIGQAVLKAAAEDFQVNEVLNIPFAEEGEHTWLFIKKTQLNTEQVAKLLAEYAGVPIRQVSYAGLKDKQAVTQQWFSVHLPGKTTPDFFAMHLPHIQVVKQHQHLRKLQRGSHKANQFILRLTDCECDIAELRAKLNIISQYGVPNYYGPQRFGREGFNVAFAQQFATAGSYPDKRPVRSRVLSSARSYLFNQILAKRVAQGTWNQLVSGDVLSFSDNNSHFPASEQSAEDTRFTELDTHPTAALWGAGSVISKADARVYDQYAHEQDPVLCDWLAQAGLKQERRITRLPVKQLAWRQEDEKTIGLEFVLPVGCFATSVLREIVELKAVDIKEG